MVRKAIDSRIHTLIKNGVENRHRSFFVIVGDRGKDQVVNLHWILSQAQVASRPSVLWCYKKELGFTSHRKKREAKIKSDIKKGIRKANDEDPFELFISVTDIRYTYYKETQNILGTTFGMCVLQDFEALTPNLLARTVETVEGGGLVVLLLKTMNSLKQLYTMTMDVHSRYRTEAHQDVVARFNERFILSLGSCDSCLVVDDELNVLPISMGKNTKPLPTRAPEDRVSDKDRQLADLKASLAGTQPIGSLVAKARTLDQAQAVMTFVDAISEKALRSTVTLTASRGRGKSAALGIAMAAAVAYGYSNIFVTSPSPENLKTLFDFIFQGFDALGYEEHLDYDIVQSTNPDFHKAIVRVNIFRQHRQTIQYIQPQDAHTLGQAELVVIDEAAAIPLPLVKKLLGPYLVFMSSTINGYEGTGRSLSLKLIQQLREQSQGFASTPETTDFHRVGRDGKPLKMGGGSTDGAVLGSTGGRSLREIKLEEPIRYADGDSTEKWLNRLLCLDASVVTKNIHGCPHPSECELYYVNRDTLFSFHPVSETFLQRMMALYVASHYKNTPNDLQLMSDAPAHHLFVLLPPVDASANTLPDPLCVVQVCLEGQISRQSVVNSLQRGVRSSGDLIPWLMSQQFQDNDFAGMSGARIVRIATHPDYANMGYGSRALDQLRGFYAGEFQNLDEKAPADEEAREASFHRLDDADLDELDLATDKPKVRDPRRMPPLLMKLSEKRAPQLHYLGVSYGLTASLHKFWKRAGFVPVYLRQTANDLTGEHTCVMLRALPSDAARQAVVVSDDWLQAFAQDFQRRFIHLLAYQFRDFTSVTALSIMNNVNPSDADALAASGQATAAPSNQPLVNNRAELFRELTPFDLKRLESYSNNLLDYHVIMDLLPTLAGLYFNHRIIDLSAKQDGDTEEYPPLTLSAIQSSILLAIGLQCKSVSDLEKELNLPSNQIMGMLIKIIKKCYTSFRLVQSQVTIAAPPSLLAPPAPAGSALDNDNNDDDDQSENGDSESTGVPATSLKRRELPTSSNRLINPDTIDAENEEWAPVNQSLDDDVGREGQRVMRALRKQQRAVVNSLDLRQYEIAEETRDWSQAESQIAKGSSSSSVVSIVNPLGTPAKRKATAGSSAPSRGAGQDAKRTRGGSDARGRGGQSRGSRGSRRGGGPKRH
ncbi:N-acetyltransferase 10 [Dimargaris cristalligena]|nr:N-acetyltransferase 10 [Dimargaris cristalligena]